MNQVDAAIPIAIGAYVLMFFVLLFRYKRRANQRAAMGNSGALTSGEIAKLFLFPLFAVPTAIFGAACFVSAVFIFGLLNAFRPRET